MLSLSTLALGNTAEISTGDVRKNQAFDNIKASVAQALRIGNLNTNLEGSYDYKANKDFFNEVTATGSILSPLSRTTPSCGHMITPHICCMTMA